jgi:hypothetical protein
MRNGNRFADHGEDSPALAALREPTEVNANKPEKKEGPRETA